ncbi:DUF4198 domain-containing protein [Methanocella conradii]|uniref:DUF4198 domain-containing protein n=1 Tax=Methanocella conradii TaxID=1175444 RepID=UPI0024B38A26|nr:DUF4198 domain-containing protein [Methanocella conradii]MDI6896278.1 DUF4198 domain-containing protein [Methanocella conradii]
MDRMILMVRGHEIWLEASKVKGKNVELELFYGHNMAVDGCPDPKNITPTIYDPAKKKFALKITPKKDSHSLKFKADKDGYYTAVADMSPETYSNTKKEGFKAGPKSMYKDVVYAGAWHQMAKTIFSVGSNGKYVAEPVHGILDIVPKDARAKVGKELELTVYYEGKKLPGVEVKAVSKKEGKEMAIVVTDNDGMAKVPIKAEGPWMFLARHRDPSKGVPDQYDEAVFVTTLTLEASKN